jgi:hypothetical protein
MAVSIVELRNISGGGKRKKTKITRRCEPGQQVNANKQKRNKKKETYFHGRVYK